MDPTFTVADVIASAGGIAPQGDPHKITLTGDGGAVVFSLTGDPAVLGRHLRPGDQIVVERLGWAHQNLGVLLGAVASVVAAAVTSLIIFGTSQPGLVRRGIAGGWLCRPAAAV